MTLAELRDKINEALEFGADPDARVTRYDEARDAEVELLDAVVDDNYGESETVVSLTFE